MFADSEFDAGFDVDRRPAGNIPLALLEAVLRALIALKARGITIVPICDLERRQSKTRSALKFKLRHYPLLHRLDNDYSEWAADHACAEGNARVFGLPAPTFGITRRVFIQSMSDLFDLEVPIEWFAEAWQHIGACNRLSILIVTKRVSVVEKRLAAIGGKWPRHAGLIITVVNQAEADRDIPRLLELKTKLGIPWVGLSIEPMLGPIDLFKVKGAIKVCGIERCVTECAPGQCCEVYYSEIDWVIVGGESGPHARPMHPRWATDIRDQCEAAGVSFHFKQWGEWFPHAPNVGGDLGGDVRRGRVTVVHPTGEDEMEVYRRTGGRNTIPGTRYVKRIGKRRAGRLLEGIEHNGMPSSLPTREAR